MSEEEPKISVEDLKEIVKSFSKNLRKEYNVSFDKKSRLVNRNVCC